MRNLQPTILTLALTLSSPAQSPPTSPRADLGESFHTVSDVVSSPHIKWARPLPGGPIRALCIGPRLSIREVVELGQRLHLETSSVIFHDSQTMGHPENRLTVDHTTTKEVHENLLKELEQDWELLIMGNIAWKAIPTDVQEVITAQVRGGKSLLNVHPDDSFASAHEGLERLKISPPSWPAQRVVPFHGLPDPAAGLRDAIRGFKQGKGRIVTLQWPGCKNGGWYTLTVNTPMPHYEYQQALVAALAMKAAGRSEVIHDLRVSRVDGDDRSITLSFAADRSETAQVEFTLNGLAAGGDSEIDHTIEIAKGDNQWSLELPPLVQDTYLCAVIVRGVTGVLGSLATDLDVRGTISIPEFAMGSRRTDPGNTAEFSGKLSGPLEENQTLDCALWDNWDREILAWTLDTVEGITEFKGTFTVPSSLTALNHLRVEIRENGRPTSRAVVELCIKREYDPGEFAFYGWGDVSEEHYTSLLAARILRDTNMDGFANCGFKEPSAHARATVNMDSIPYAWGVWGVYSENPEDSFSQLDGVRRPCLTDPSYLEGEREKFRQGVEDCSPYSPSAYTLGDESYYMLFDPERGHSVCYSPTCREGFKQMLMNDYRSIEALNVEWDTSYPNWDEFEVSSVRELPRHNPAPRADHYRYIEQVFTEAHRFAVNELKQLSPDARVGMDGSEALDSAVGYNWYQLMQMFDMQNVYPYVEWYAKAFNRHCVRSFARPGTLLGMWYGGYTANRSEQDERWHPWYSLFLGYNSIWWYDVGKPGEIHNALAPDYRFVEAYQWTLDEIAELKGGAGRLLIGARRQHDGIAIHYSTRSFAVDSVELGGRYERRPGQHAVATAEFMQMILDQGLQFEMLATEQIEDGKLTPDNFKVLILPTSQSLTQKETDAIIRFVEDGGCVIADWLTGVRDEHSKPIEIYPIDEIFGFKRSKYRSIFNGEISIQGEWDGVGLSLQLPHRECADSLILETAQTMGYCETIFKVCMLNRYGKGRTAFFNFSVEGYHERRYEGREGEWREFMRRLLAWCDVAPGVTVTRNSQPLPGIETVRFRDEPLEYVGMFREYRMADRKPRRAEITFPDKTYVYDVRAGKSLGRKQSISTRFEPGIAKLFALSPYKVKSLEIGVHDTPRRPGDEVELQFQIRARDAEPGRHVVRVEVEGPDGDERKHYAKNVECPGGLGAYTLATALNDPPGEWIITARDTMSGVECDATIELQRSR